MHTMSKKSRKACVDIDNADTMRNSELILDLVMAYLPTKDCVRTSILSSKWRYRWTTIPCLTFDTSEYCPRLSVTNLKKGSKAVASVINRVLLLHTGSMQVFQVKDLCIVPDIDCWILRISKHSIKTLVLELLDIVRYKLPSSLFACGSLSSLKLQNCLLRPPSSFKGFKKLKCLELKHVTLTNDAFEKLILSCPLLEKLTLHDLKEANKLKINAPNLQDVVITSDFVDITFRYPMTRLSVTSIYSRNCACASLIDFFIKHPNIQRLQLKCFCTGYMPGDSILKGLPFLCKDLCRLAINMELSFSHSRATLYLFRNSVNLTELQILAQDKCHMAIKVGVRDDKSKCHYDFEKLRWVRMENFGGTTAELDFVEFVLGNSPVLEMMTVNPDSDNIKWRDFKGIYEFKRASEAKIYFDRRVTQIC